MVEHDKAAIIELINLYAFALDTAQWDLFDRIFTEDVTADFGPASALWRDLASFKRAFGEFHATLDNYQHTMMGHLVHVNGDTALLPTAIGCWCARLRREAPPGLAPAGMMTSSCGLSRVGGSSGVSAGCFPGPATRRCHNPTVTRART